MRDNKAIIYISIIAVFILLLALPASSLKVETHDAINQHIAENNTVGFSLDDYLKGNLGLTNGYKEIIIKGGISNRPVQWWLGQGGIQEDESLLRSRNHFHNPLKPWDDAGYRKGIEWGHSSILWAQDLGNDYSWQNVRKYYHIALTGRDFTDNVVAPSKDARDVYFADTFRGLGQLMHLVQDAASSLYCRHSRESGNTGSV
jgi:hypothetical protein